MTKIDIFSGFLGAGKTTLIKKLIKEAFAGEKLVLIENEFGEIGIDGGFLQDAGIAVTEMNSGCICCSLVGDFGEALKKVLAEYAPDRILIEPSGVGKLSDVIAAVQGIAAKDVTLNSFTTVVDAKKCRMYQKNFGEFFNNQIEYAGTIILSHTDGMDDDKLAQTLALIREHNTAASIVTTPWDNLSGAQILESMEHRHTLSDELQALLHTADACSVCGHHHEHEHEHHHHHHEHDEHCDCGCHDHHHHEHDHDHHHHHADDVFVSWGRETAKTYTVEKMTVILQKLADKDTYGDVLRAKGIVAGEGEAFIHFDYVPNEPDVRTGSATVIGRICVIGAGLKEDALAVLFEVG